MGVTIYDVAKKAGVGIGTVSRVINNSPQISPITREKVIKIIKELKYQPSVMAQSLARKKSNIIACVVPRFTGYFYFEVLNGIQQALGNHGYDLILYNVDKLEKKEEILKRITRERKVDGVLLISMPISDKYVTRFRESKLPIVIVDSYHDELDSITIENKEGAFLATEHLIKLGHQRIGMINGNLRSVPAANRLEGFKAALNKYHIICHENLIINVGLNGDPEVLYNDGFNKKAGYKAMNKLLGLNHDRPTAIFISSDIQATGAIKAIQEYGLKIPTDITLIGFDDIELSEYLGLTTVHQPMYEMGKLAVDRLMEKIAGKNTENTKTVFPTKLVIRETCGVYKKNS
ncbi:LacI family transcriptional regulator [candidate division KSB1 bacterium]|nr:LacI family transcriptional regulator [candidate division KSB1 bacterium]